MSATYRRPEEVWPTGGTPLVREVRSPYFMPVTEEILAEITRRIVAELDPEKVILFGSYAYGSPNPDSDVDLVVIMDSVLSPAERALAVCRLIRPRPFPVDIIVKTPDEVREAVARGDYFLRKILDKGRELFQRSSSIPSPNEFTSQPLNPDTPTGEPDHVVLATLLPSCVDHEGAQAIHYGAIGAKTVRISGDQGA